MRVLLLSTYELGHQPLGIAGPAGALEAAGHHTAGVDLAMSDWPGREIAWADAVAISIPMHTATRLALDVLVRLRVARPELPVALHGLYAPVLESNDLVQPGDLLVAGDAAAALIGWLDGLDGPDHSSGRARAASARTRVRIDLGPARPEPTPPPLRRGLPRLDSYARLVVGDREVVTASVEASRGCNHTCRHCPVAAVYRGRSRPVAIATVLADIDQVVTAGARHLSFADPDFLNRPRHALEIARALHRAHPEVTFDSTVKIEHVLRHRDIWPELAASGLLFVVSAFESVDDAVLRRLDKGHTAADEVDAVGVLRAAGVEVRPSWLPFTPWATLDSVGALLEFSAVNDLVWSTDPVQYSIRLLLPEGSLLLVDPDPDLSATLTSGTDNLGSVAWRSADPRIDGLQRAIAARAEEGGANSETPPETFAAIWRSAREAGVPLDPLPPEPRPGHKWLPGPIRPHLSEAWFCCAEPTVAQLANLAPIPAAT